MSLQHLKIVLSVAPTFMYAGADGLVKGIYTDGLLEVLLFNFIFYMYI